MQEIEFNSKEELYNKVKPALNSKVLELKRLNITYIKEEDIWNYLIDNIWNKANDLTLNDIVSDILHLDENKIKEYTLGLLRNTKRDIKEANEDLL